MRATRYDHGEKLTYLDTYKHAYMETYMNMCVCVHICMYAQSHAQTASASSTALPIITEDRFQVFQRNPSSKLVLKAVESRFAALNYYENGSTLGTAF